MNTDDLDGRIRALVHDAVAAAPAAPDLPAAMPSGVPVVAAPPNRGRGWVWAGIGISASVIAVGVLVMTNRDDSPSVVAGSTSSDVSTTVDPNALPWPDGVSVIVASDRGIEKITNENGQAVVTRLVSGESVARAFELEDGSIVYQTTGDKVVWVLGREGDEPLASEATLDDADAPGGNLRLVYSTEGTKPEDALTLTAHFVPNDPVSYPQPGGWAVGYRRFTIVDDHAVTTATMDDTGQRTGVLLWVNPIGVLATYGLEAATPTPFQQVGDGSGSIGVLDEKGQFTSYGTRSGFTANLGDPIAVTDLDFRGQWLAVQRNGGTSSLVDLVGGTSYDLPVAGGTISVSRKDRVDTQPVPTTVPAPSTSLEPGPTTTVSVDDPAPPFPNCLTVTASTTADVQLGSIFSSLEPIPEEQIEVSGRPAVLTTFGATTDASGTGYGVVFRQPDWCTEYGMTTNTMSKADFLAWLQGVTVTENLPTTMPPVLLRSSHGLSVVSSTGTRVVYRGAVDQALLLAGGRVVYHSPDLADFQMWDPTTDSSEPIWAAADWIAQPVLQDAFGSSFVFSVNDRLYSYDTDQTWPLDGVPTRRLSITADGVVDDAFTLASAVDPLGLVQVSLDRGGAVRAIRLTDGAVLYQVLNSDIQVTDVDVNNGWITISELPPGDSQQQVTMVELATGRALTFWNVTGGHLG